MENKILMATLVQHLLRFISSHFFTINIFKASSLILLIVSIGCSQTTDPKVVDDNLIFDWQSNPQFSRDGQKIVFEGLYDSIYAIHFVDKNGIYLGHILDSICSKNYVSSPSWGSNNNIVVSVEGNLSIVNISNDSLTQLTSSYQDFSCTWSKDGNYIAYTKSICDPDCGIALYNLSNNTTRIIGKFGGYASWDNNSDRLYYYENVYSHGFYKGFVFKSVDLNTLNVDSLFYVNSNNADLWLSDLNISPDGKEIVFAASEGTPPQIYIWKINLELKTLIKITIGNHPAFSPDGSQIIYTNTNRSEGGLWIMNKDGSNKKRFTKLNK
ncbi:MAG: hypothetical protein BroJett005_31090 [Ignavibacteriota bacterium]|nr:MAG: hypothetical protein BroJett005_31090 [Ignavibacteriota bacterium]